VEHVLAIVVLVGIVDSMNPSTIAPALYLGAGGEATRSLVGFIAGVFFTNLAAGVLLALGPGQAVMSHVPHPGDEARHLIELTAGGILVIVGIALWIRRERVSRHVTATTQRIDRSSLLLGAGIVVVELPTALPYFAAIAAVVDSGKSIPTQVVLLAIFNLCFVLPLLAILGLYTLAGEGARRWLRRARANIDRWLATLVPGLVLVIGLALIAIGAYGLLRDKT
jgi:cytochrome c biogenesis protein CcdA